MSWRRPARESASSTLAALAAGASQASAGVLAPYIEGHESGPLRELGRRSLDLYDDFVARVTAASAMPVQYARNGTLEIALEPEDAERLRAAGARTDGRWRGRSLARAR